MESNPFEPHVSEELIKYLSQIYPDKSPELKWTDKEVWFHRGEVQVVRHLTNILNKQKENMLTAVPKD